MKRSAGLAVFSLLIFQLICAQPAPPGQEVFTSDIDHFWTACDSVRTTTDSVRQLIALKPGHEYEFVLTGRSFRSADGYSLTPYAIHFKTRP